MVALLLLGAMALFSVGASRGLKDTWLGRAMLEVVGPVQSAVTGAADWVHGGVKRYFFLVQAAKENDQLRHRVAAMRQELADQEELKQANARLRKLLGLTERLTYPVVAAEVVGSDPTVHFKSAIINKGTATGVQNLMPVVHDAGVVGRVVWASPHFAKVLLLIDPNSGVDVLIQRTRARGVVEGAGDNLLRLKYALHTDNVAIGDRVVTSGAAGVYPKGLLVGTVRSVTSEGKGVFQQVDVEPAVDFDRLEDVLVILHRRRFVD